MMKIMDQVSCVISSPRPGLRSRKVCVTRRPWVETSARLFDRVCLECRFYVLCLH